MNAVLRDMTLADLDVVCALENRLFPVDYWPRQMFIDELSRPETRRYLVAEAAGAVVGYAGLMCIEPTADVQTIAVVPEAEGRGIGSALLTALIAEARGRGARDVLLEVRADNPRAQQLYLRFGFEQIHVRPRYYRDGANALIMRLDVTDGGGSRSDDGDGGPGRDGDGTGPDGVSGPEGGSAGAAGPGESGTR